MFIRNSSVNFWNMLYFENMQLERENPQFILDMFKLISTSNRVSMKMLLSHGCISYNQMKSDLLEIFYQLYQTPIECSTFHIVLNSHVTSYLQSVIYDNDGFRFSSKQRSDQSMSNPILILQNGHISCEIPIIIEKNSNLSERRVTNSKCTEELKQSDLHKSDKLSPNDKKVIEEFSVSFEISVENKGSNVSSPPTSKDHSEHRQLSTVSDFQSFLSPLEQDHTKSSKGYTCLNNSFDKKIENSFSLWSHNNFPDIEDVDSSEVSVSDDENYDPAHDLIISRYFDSLQSSSTESEVGCNKVIYDSDSDDSVVFSENIVEAEQRIAISEKCGIDIHNETIDLGVSINYDSDSDDNTEFFELFNNKLLIKSAKTNIKDGFDSDISDSSDDLFQNYNGADTDSFFQSLDFRVNNMEFSNISYSLSQNKMHVYSTEFEGFVNPCFEDDSTISSDASLRLINEKWEQNMQDIPSEPRQPKRVSFVPLPDLVSVQTYEPDGDGYKYSTYVLDQIRFKYRVEEFEDVMKPYLSSEHRAKVYKSYYSSDS